MEESDREIPSFDKLEVSEVISSEVTSHDIVKLIDCDSTNLELQ